VTTILIIIAAVPVLLAAHDLIRRPVIRRQALRNVVRHRGETVLVIAGTLLGTAIITASFVVGDSFSGSIRDLARTALGPVDELIAVEPDQLDDVLGAIEAAPIESVDGVLVLESSSAAVVSVSDDPRGDPRVRVFGIDVADAAAFGDDPAITGFENVVQPALGEALLGEDVARTLESAVGDEVTIHLLGNETTLRVVGVVESLGLAGRGDPVFINPAELTSLAAGGDEDTRLEVLVSNTGGVFEGAELSREVTHELEQRLDGIDVEVREWKADLLDDAAAEGQELTTIFAGIGSFAVIAGILLLINLFTMLAEERRTDIGVMRALGTKRNVVVRQLGLEGTVYATVSATLGVIAGAGVGWLIMLSTRSLFDGGDNIQLNFAMETSSIIYGATIGLIISLATIWITSNRLSRLNIIRAIRQLPEPATEKGRRRVLIVGLATFALGVALTVIGLSGSSDLAAIVGPAVAAFATIPIIGPRLPRPMVVTVASLVAMAWGLFSFTLLPDILDDTGISGFVAQGLVLVGGAVLMVTTHDRLWVRLAPDGLATRLGLANSLARKTRTGLLLAMYALVIFMITFMAVFSSVFTRQADDLADGISAGHDLLVDTSFGNPVEADELLAVDGVSAVSIIDRAWLDFSADWAQEDDDWTIAGVKPSLFDNGEFDVIERAPRFETDRAALLSIFEDPNAIVVPEFFLVDNDGPGGVRPSAGEVVVATDSDTGQTRRFEVAAVTSSDWVFTGPLVSAASLDSLVSGDTGPTRAYVALDNPADADNIVARIDAQFLANGAVSTSFVGAVADEIAETAGFIRILSGYLGLGLVIGIAGLGVVLVRGVRERRREIGMLRAIGVDAATVRSMFIIEAAFIGAVGALIGTGLGLVTGFQVVTKSSLFGDTSVSYVTPWTVVLIVMIGPLIASLLAAMIPAGRAAKLRPSEALRLGT